MFDDLSHFATPKFKVEIRAEKDGFIQSMNAENLGSAAVLLGAGRTKKDDKIDFTAGITLYKKTGDCVQKGEVLAEICSSTVEDFTTAGNKILSSYKIGDGEISRQKLIYRVITK